MPIKAREELGGILEASWLGGWRIWARDRIGGEMFGGMMGMESLDVRFSLDLRSNVRRMFIQFSTSFDACLIFV